VYTKKEVKFEHPGMGADFCGKCKFFLPKENRCQIVSGEILAGDWCNKFREKEMKTVKESHEDKPYPAPKLKEHTHIRSRITNRMMEIPVGPQPGGLVPRNPFASLAQEGYLHAHPEKLGPKKLAEFDAATKGKHLPKRVKKL
jgi:hypothetical protein